MLHLFKDVKELTVKSSGKQFTNQVVTDSIKSLTDFLAKEQLSLFEENPANYDLFINLSEVQFSLLSAINFLILNVDSLCKREKIKNVYVALPTIGSLFKEIESTSSSYTEELKKGDRDRRQSASNFLKKINFLNTLKESVEYYGTNIFFSNKFQLDSTTIIGSFSKAFEVDENIVQQDIFGYHFLYPLEWIYVKDDVIDYDNLENKFNKTLLNEQRGLDVFDVKAFKNVIFHELRKNVLEHTEESLKPKRFLLSMGLISTQSKDSNPFEQAFYDFIEKEKIASLVEIYFGDTGGGFFTNEYVEKCKKDNITASSDQLKWAFKRWSTKKFEEERRGTKGLYRILRIINNYKGIIQIQTNTHTGGYFFDGQWKYEKSNDFKGSFVQIKLCPYSVIKEFKFDISPKNIRKDWRTVLLTVSEDIDTLKKQIQSEFRLSEDLNYFFILDVDKIIYTEIKEIESVINDILLEISYNAHPSGAVVFVNSKEGSDTVSNIINSTNEFIQNKSSLEISESYNNEDLYEPIIVIHNSKVLWYGGSPLLISILDELYEDNFNKKIYELEEYDKLEPDWKIRLRQNLENDNNLVTLDREGNIKLSFINLEKHFSDILNENIGRDIAPQKDQKFCSSKMEIINYWVDVANIIKDNEYGFALALYLKLLEQTSLKNITGNLFLLIDHEQHYDLALALSKLLNMRESNIINHQKEVYYNSLKRFKLFPEKSTVIILTSIITTSETIRRLVKCVKRDNALPLVILCLENYRKYNVSSIETWGNTVEILSIRQEFTVEGIKRVKDEDYFQVKNDQLIDFNGKLIQPDYKEGNRINKELFSEDLLDLLKESKSLHYNHIGVKNDRHFTFYVNKPKILDKKSFLWDEIERQIKNWKELNKIKDFTIFIKNDLITDSKTSEFHKFISFLSGNHVELFKVSPRLEASKALSINKPKNNIFVIDFGILSGTTINEIFSNSKGLDNLFICILFKQNNANELNHYRRIIALSDNDSDLGKISQTNIKVNFLYNLPLNFFSRDNCPICSHNDALDVYKMSNDETDYMFNFSEDRQLKLGIRSKDEIFLEEYPFDFYYLKNEKTDHELSGEIIKKMFIFKIILEDALTDTNSRIEIFNLIFDIYKNKSTQIKDQDSYLYAVLYFLSFEVHWLQKEPLVFTDLREMLSDISCYVATYNFDELLRYFSDNQHYIVNPEKSVTRYKYSAISLLRSTNKLKFCDHVFAIISNSDNGHKFSDNLLQNTFFHTYSIIKNKYNKSTKYYESLIQSYAQVKNIVELSEGQRFISNKLYYLLYSKLTEVDIDDLKDLDLVKLLKKYILENYKGFGHPQLETNINDLNLEHISPEGLRDIELNRYNSQYYSSLKAPLSNSISKWDEIQRYLYQRVIPLYKKLSSELKNSTTFKDEYQLSKTFEQISDQNSNNQLHNFNKLLKKLEGNHFYYLEKKREYDEILDFVSSRLIKIDSDLLQFSYQFPVDIEKTVLEGFSKHQFPKIKTSINKPILAFYPESRLKKDITAIIGSIENRLIESFRNEEFVSLKIFSEVELEINISEDKEFINLTIKYNGTSSERHKHGIDQKGGLESIKYEIQKFGGSLHYIPENDINGFFNINFKFLKYE